MRDGANLKQSNVGGRGAEQVVLSNNGEVESPGLSDRRRPRRGKTDFQVSVLYN